MQFGELPEGRNPFGFKDGLHDPHVEGSGPAVRPGSGAPIKAGEFIVGYPDERGEIATAPIPQELRAGLSSCFANFIWTLPGFAATCGRRPPPPRKRS